MTSFSIRTVALLFLTACAIAVSPICHYPTAGAASTTDSLADAVECRPRGGLPNFLAKARAGGEVRVAYLGGSITEMNGWRSLSFNWLQQQYPNAKFEEIRAAISGTGSDFGVARLERDVLQHKPDLLFVEFAVNDSAARPERIRQAMEGIVRKTWAQSPTTDICFVYSVMKAQLENLQNGKFSRSASAMEQIAEHYGIPSIHLGMEVARLEEEGKIVFAGRRPATDAEKVALGDKVVFSGDGIHPYTETGHPYYLAAIVRSMPAIGAVGTVRSHKLPIPLEAGNWAAAQQVPLSELQHSPGWQKLDSAQEPYKTYTTRFPELWKATTPGESLSFRFDGMAFGFAGLKGPDVGTFAVTVDDQAPVKATFFDSFSTENRYRIKYWFYPRDLSAGPHQVKIDLLAEAPDKQKILASQGLAMKDPEQFKNNSLYIGDVLVVGEVDGKQVP